MTLNGYLLKTSSDTSPAPVRIQLKLDTITDKNSNAIHAHLSGKVSQNDFFGIRKLHSKKSVRQRLNDSAVRGIFCFCRSIHFVVERESHSSKLLLFRQYLYLDSLGIQGNFCPWRNDLAGTLFE